MELTHPEFSLTQDKEEALQVLGPANPLPRSVLRPNFYHLLDGSWSFDTDIKDCGLRDNWFLDHVYTRTAVWPGSIEAHLTEMKEQDTPAWQDKVIVWYEREFTIPEPAVPLHNSLWQITFGACGYETCVWLNGQPLRTIEGEETHYGFYTSFSYELPADLLRPVNRLTVRIVDTMDAEIPRGKQESHVYKRGGIWYQTYSGGVRTDIDRYR